MNTILSGASVIVAAADQVSCELEGEAVILNLKSGVYYGLDQVGARIWKLVQQPRRVDELCDVLIQEYDVEPEKCAADLFALLTALLAEGLIVVDRN